ncbi:conserved hypothetical protein [Uncinocarpus reesii 1704]|uniref:Sin3 binding protein n=1 Tax=Uncinocarpus reesii (strain UAMH 1704) TaxID=336963 RepID=C4JK50_UNCRE|nr:uncharacterized protein UREG_02007 [Uncinocarpus reesii 1704]EEP77158.1 conserved hypothetical protein [Uncinocarpus reesii 1704]
MAPFQAAQSSIATALAGKTPSVEIPKPCNVRYSGRAGVDHQPGQPAMLPTPPSSISPALHPHGFKHRVIKSPDSLPFVPQHIDSDIDLHDAVDLHKPRDKLVLEALNSLDSTEGITPTMLAKHHLPDILLNHGPLAIRHIIGHLTTSVPGFSSIPPAKARRLVVGALEGKGGNGESGGVHGDVEFDKVGWGRWDARRRGQGLTKNRPAGAPSSCAKYISHSRGKSDGSAGLGIKEEHDRYGSSFAGNSAVFSHSEWEHGDHPEHSMLDETGTTEATAHRRRPQTKTPLWTATGDEADATDEEDWAQIGAAALRARFIPGGFGGNHHAHNYLAMRSKGGLGGGPAWSTLTKSAPGPIHIHNNNSPSPDGIDGSFEERAAVEALLQMGSM